MDIDAFLTYIDDKHDPEPAQADDVAAFEAEVGIGGPLPADYRAFLVACNGGNVGGVLWFVGESPDGGEVEAGVDHVGGLRDDEKALSLRAQRKTYAGKIPADLLWIMDDPFGNAICLGLSGPGRGKVVFWDFEAEDDGNPLPLAASFTDFVAGLDRPEED